MKPVKHPRGKRTGQYLCWKIHDAVQFLFCAHTLCINYVTAMFLLVGCMNTGNHLCILQVLCRVNPQNSEQKYITKNFARLYNHFPLLAMIWNYIFH